MEWDEAVAGYWLHRRRDVSVNTFNDYDRTFRRFGESVTGKCVAEIGTDDVRRFLNAMAEAGNKPKTIANAWTALSAFWTWAEKALQLKHVVRGQVPPPRVRKPAIEPYARAQVKALLAACETAGDWVSRGGRPVKSKRPTARRDRAMLLVLLDTGVRASELCGLTVNDYESSSGRLRIRMGKGGKDRAMFCGEAAQRALWRYLTDRRGAKPSDPLFATASGRHLTRDNLLKLIVRIAGRAGVSNANVHRFRHTFAIQFLRNGGSVLALQAALGHERMETVRIYARLSEVDLQAAQRSASPADCWKF